MTIITGLTARSVTQRTRRRISRSAAARAPWPGQENHRTLAIGAGPLTPFRAIKPPSGRVDVPGGAGTRAEPARRDEVTRMTGRADRMVVSIATGIDLYQTALLRGMCRVLTPLGIPLVAYTNRNYSAHYGPDGSGITHGNCDLGPVVHPALECLLRHRDLLGVAVANSLSSHQQAALGELTASLNLPVVYIAQDLPGQDCVRGDNAQGIRAVMEHLLDDRGARRLALVRGLAHQPDHVEREAVFRREITARGLTVDEELVLDGAAEREVARNAMRALLARRRDLDAVVTTDDLCAEAVVSVLHEHGLRVPDDVMVTGFDDYPNASMTWPGLTTVDQDLVGQGANAARLLLDQATGCSPRGTVVTPCRLVVRGSTIGDAANGTDGEVSARSIARAAQLHLNFHHGVRRLGRVLAECRTLADVGEALSTCLFMLDVRRCFLVVHERAEAGGPDGVPHQLSRLVLDHRDGVSHPIPDPVFSSCRLLPDSLRSELREGQLVLQMMIMNDETLGYLLTEHLAAPVAVMEQVALDVTRAVQVVLSTQELEQRVEERTRELQVAQGELLSAARRAGMAEIATNVLHNVGNVLNSVNISAGRLARGLQESRSDGLRRAVGLLSDPDGHLGAVLADDAEGRLLLEYLVGIDQALGEERATLLEEAAQLRKRVNHIKAIVATQQSYAGVGRITEFADVADLVDDACISAESLARQDVEVVRACETIPMLLDRARIVLVLVNLINAARRWSPSAGSRRSPSVSPRRPAP